MGALPKRRISSYRKGKRRSEIKKNQKKTLQSNKSFAQHALKKASTV